MQLLSSETKLLSDIVNKPQPCRSQGARVGLIRRRPGYARFSDITLPSEDPLGGGSPIETAFSSFCSPPARNQEAPGSSDGQRPPNLALLFPMRLGPGPRLQLLPRLFLPPSSFPRAVLLPSLFNSSKHSKPAHPNLKSELKESFRKFATHFFNPTRLCTRIPRDRVE